jgi:hypothetical protein
MVDTKTSLDENSVYVWQDHYAKAAYASEAVVHLMGKEGFSSAEVQRLFLARSGFMSRLHLSKGVNSSDENRFLGAVLSKLALRGNPAMCSLRVERYILRKAQDEGLLVFEESVENGKIRFSCRPLMKDLDLMLRICCLPELLVDDGEVDLLLNHYEALLEEFASSKRFFRKLLSVLPDKRLALFVVPCSRLGPDYGKEVLEDEDQIDFVIQIPNLKRKTHLKIAIQLGESLKRSDKEGDWTVKRFGQMKPQYWESEVRKLADQISYALSDDVLDLAKRLRELPTEQKKAIEELISLPIAEAQLTQVISGLIYTSEKAEIAIGNPQNLDLVVVIEAIQETIRALSSLYSIPGAFEPRLVENCMESDLDYYTLPTGTSFSCASIVPRFIDSCPVSIRLDALPKSIKGGDSSTIIRNSLKFILNNVFRCKEFLLDQAELVEQMLSMRGTIGILKPGAGKRLACQMASILEPGITLVVVPTKYMALDQKYSLAAMGIHQCRDIFGADEEWQKSRDSMKRHESDILFLAADAMQDLGSMSQLIDSFSYAINFLVFDEAHCLSEWSHGFQTGYLNLVRRAKDWAPNGSNPSLVALTSVNSKLVLLDIMNELDVKDPQYIVESSSYDRSNLKFEIHKVNAENRMHVLVSALRATLREYGRKESNPKIPSGIVISAHEDDDDIGIANLSKSLGKYLNVPVGVSSLEPPKKFQRMGGSRVEWEKACQKALLQFKRNELPILVCTGEIANKLGKEDIRFTLHIGIPASLEEFYRQSCRAGHDGKQSSCLLFFFDDCENSGQKKVLTGREEYAQNGEQLDNEFPGRVMEKRILSRVILRLLVSAQSHSIGDEVDSEISVSSFPDRLFSINGELKVPSERKQKLLEKALYRLLLIGAIVSYERRPASFKVRVKISKAPYIYKNFRNYINRYELEGLAAPNQHDGNDSSYKNAVLRFGCRLIEYSYDRIKIRRAEDKSKMLLAAKDGQISIRRFQDCLHESMVPSEIEARLAAMASESRWSVLGELKGLDDLLGLLLVCYRELRQRPDDPMLRVIAGFCALAFPGTMLENNNFMDGFSSLKNSTSASYRADLARQIVSYAELLMPSKSGLILESIWQADPSLEISRLCYERSGHSSEICYSSLFKLVNGLLEALQAEGV